MPKEKKQREVMTMNREEFIQELVNRVQEQLGEGYNVSLTSNLKVNDIEEEALCIMCKECNIAPLIKMDNLFQLYKETKRIEKVVDYVIENLVEQGMKEPYDFNVFADYERVKRNIFPRLINPKFSKKYLADKVYREWLDLGVSYYFSFDLADNLGEYGYNSQGKVEGRIAILKKHLEMWEVSEEELHKQAMENQQRVLSPNIQDVYDVILKEIIEQIEEREGVLSSGYLTDDQLNFIVTTLYLSPYTRGQSFILNNPKSYNYGAVQMYASNAIAEFAEQMDGNVIIIPSSINEVLLMKENEDNPIEEVAKTVRTVNETKVEPKMWLSNSVYRYNYKSKKIEVAYQG